MPEHSPATFEALLALSKAVTDPEAKKNIEEMRKLSAEAEQVAADKTTAAKTLGQAQRIKDEHAIVSAARDKALGEREAALEVAKATHDEKAAAFASSSSAKERDLTEREQRVASGLRSITERERKLTERSEAVTAQEAAWAEKARRISEAATG